MRAAARPPAERVLAAETWLDRAATIRAAGGG